MQFPVLYLIRNQYGQVIAADWDKSRLNPQLGEIKHRAIKSTKDLTVALLQSGSRKVLTDWAWRQAVKDGAVDPCHRFTYGDPLDLQTIEYARQESNQVDFYIGLTVNNPISKFYIHG